MKLDRETSKKNVYAKSIKMAEDKIQKIETSNGRLTITSALASFSIFVSILNTISLIGATNINVALGILNVVIMMLSGLVLDRSFVKLINNNKKKKEWEFIKKNIKQMLEKDELLENQSLELNKILCKKSNIVYFPQK